MTGHGISIHSKWLDTGISVLVFLVVGIFLSELSLYLDYTCHGTANGLWKSVFIQEYLDTGGAINYTEPNESSFISNLFYFPVYAFFLGNWPLAASGLSTVMKMTLVNSWFGALAIAGSVYLFRFWFRNWFISLAAGFFHLSCAMVLTVSTNSEDIIPSYSFFILCLIPLSRYIRYKTPKNWLVFSVLFSISWLFHWTMALAPLPILLFFLWGLEPSLRKTMVRFAQFAGVNFGMGVFWALIFGAEISRVLYPAKGMDTGMAGFALLKWGMMLTAWVQYFIGGFQFNGPGQFVEVMTMNNWYHLSFGVGAFLLLFLLGTFLVRLFSTSFQPELRPMLIFLAGTFLGGWIVNAFEFGTDLQFHLQPMFWAPFSFGLLLLVFKKKVDALPPGGWKQFAGPVVILTGICIPAILLGMNVFKFRMPYQGQDSLYFGEVKKIEQRIGSLERAFFVTRGWDYFRNWAYAKWGAMYLDHATSVVDYVLFDPEKSIGDVENEMDSLLRVQSAEGRIILAGPEIIELPLYEISDVFSGFGQPEKIAVLVQLVRSYPCEPFLETDIGTFFQLFPDPVPTPGFD